jgi:FkbM family methyltransferase
MRWIVGSSDHGCWLGTYEGFKRRRYEQLVKPGMVAFDIGAHVGYYTLLSSALVGNSGSVVAFEPLPENIEYLKRHVALNQLENVQIIEAAVTDRDRKMTFNIAPSRSMGYLSEGGNLEVEAISLDQFLTRDDVPTPQVLKIDVEGAELSVLQGAQNLITTCRPLIFLATHGDEIHRQCLERLQFWGYSLEPLDGVQIDQSSEVLARHGRI